MSPLAVALLAAAGGILVVLVVGRHVLQPGRRQGEAGADELRRAQREVRWARLLTNLTETRDLDDLLGRVLQGAGMLVDADAAAVALWEQGEPPVVKTMSLTPEEASPLLGSWPEESRSRSLTIRYRFPGESLPGRMRSRWASSYR